MEGQPRYQSQPEPKTPSSSARQLAPTSCNQPSTQVLARHRRTNPRSCTKPNSSSVRSHRSTAYRRQGIPGRTQPAPAATPAAPDSSTASSAPAPCPPVHVGVPPPPRHRPTISALMVERTPQCAARRSGCHPRRPAPPAAPGRPWRRTVVGQVRRLPWSPSSPPAAMAMPGRAKEAGVPVRKDKSGRTHRHAHGVQARRMRQREQRARNTCRNRWIPITSAARNTVTLWNARCKPRPRWSSMRTSGELRGAQPRFQRAALSRRPPAPTADHRRRHGPRP